ncbi:acyl-CoA dehydrogenase family protein [Kitasatospora sp. NPDC048722]|uniref:acyl-CoA dehydrogenase family protein n=1 Tax=Kitasatospora sp. NPDC048722 TaxID=3155639 RepID=UPI0034087622
MSISQQLADVRSAGRTAGTGSGSASGPVAESILVARPLAERTGLVLPAGPLTYCLASDLAITWARPAAFHVGPAGTMGEDLALRVSGTLPRVPWGGSATVLVVAQGPGGPVLFPVDPARTTVATGSNLAGESRDTLHLADFQVPAELVRPLPPDLLTECELRAALARAALIAGAAERCVELTVAHTSGRIQFGRPLSHFQAVKQEEARLIEESALVGAAVEAAGEAVELHGFEAVFAIAAAKAQASASVAEITRIAHQLHGAIGFTELSELRFATTRLWSWRDEDGDEAHWSARLGRTALAQRAEDLWPLLTGTKAW